MDSFMEMLPQRLQDDPEGFAYRTAEMEGKPLVVVQTGPTGKRVLSGMRHAVAAMAGQGNDLIVDDVMMDGVAAEYATLLASFAVVTVGVVAPLDVLEARERSRGDRLIGLARWQVDRVHDGIAYDLVVDTSTGTPMACAELIRDAFNL